MDKPRVFLLNTADYTIGIYCLRNNTISQILTEKTVTENQNSWRSTLVSQLVVPPGNDFKDIFFSHHSEYPRAYYEFEELLVTLGEFYPRIYRPQFIYNTQMFFRSPLDEVESLREEIKQIPDYLPTDFYLALSSVTQLSSLIEEFKSIARVVQPTKDNLNVYGNEIRSLLILACTEVESQLRAIVNANRITALERPKTTDYFLLKEPLRLSEYKISFSLYPWLNDFSPPKALNGMTLTML